MKPARRAAALSCRNLVVSVLLHVWFAAVAMQLVWRYWETESEREAEAALIPPGGGGGGGGTVRAVLPREKARTLSRRMADSRRVITSTQPSVALKTSIARRNSADPMTVRMDAGRGMMGSSGNSLFPGEGGYGAGYGSGCCETRKLLRKNPALPALPALPAGSVQVIILDASPSMRASEAGMAQGLVLLKGQLADLPPDALFNVVCFAETARPMSAKPLAATPENKAAALAFAQKSARPPAEDSRSSGTSRLDLGMAEALRQTPGRILLISDGFPIVRENGHSLSQTELLARIRSLYPEDGPRPELHTVSPESQQSGFLRKLAAEFGGGEDETATR